MQKKRLLPLTAIVVAILLATTGMSVISARFLDNGSTAATTATAAVQIDSTSAVSAKPPVVLAAVAETEPAPTTVMVPVTEPAPTIVPVVTPTPVSDVQLISLEDATKIALAQVASDAVIIESKLDRDDNTYEYEFKMTAGGFQYEIEINAVTGSVISLDKEDDSDRQKPDEQKNDGQKPGNHRFGSQRAIDQRSAQAAENIPYANSQGYQKSMIDR